MAESSTPPTLDPSSFFAAALAKWKPILGTVIALIVLSGTSILVSSFEPDRDLDAGVVVTASPSVAATARPRRGQAGGQVQGDEQR